MNLHQMRFVQEAVRRNLNLTETAKALNTSQPGISKAILELEEELGIDIFVRHGKRLRGLTEPGRLVLRSVELIMQELANLRRIGDEHSKQDTGTLTVAATHALVYAVLPEALAQARRQWPKLQLRVVQGSPVEVANLLLDDRADMGLATEALPPHEPLVTLPCNAWQHMALVPSDHALARIDRLTLAALAAHPLLACRHGLAGRQQIDLAFAQAGLKPQFVLEATDTELVKACVRQGLGVGLVAETAVRDWPAAGDFVALPLGHLLGRHSARLAFRRGAYLRPYVFAFAQLLGEGLTRPFIERALRQPSPARGDDVL